MNQSPKRGRRPEPDSAHLAAVADILLREPRLAPTHAFRQVAERLHGQHSVDSTVRRFRRKWQAVGVQLLAEARERDRARQVQAMKATYDGFIDRIQQVVSSPGFRELNAKWQMFGEGAARFRETHAPALDRVSSTLRQQQRPGIPLPLFLLAAMAAAKKPEATT